MNGPEHYAEAERLLDLADSPAGRAMKADGYDAIAAAQAHATLALVAATVADRIVSPQQSWGGHDLTVADLSTWGVTR